MNLKDKTRSVTVRLSEEQYQFAIKDAEMFGIKLSDYVRMLIRACMYTAKKVDEAQDEMKRIYEDKKTVLNDQL